MEFLSLQILTKAVAIITVTRETIHFSSETIIKFCLLRVLNQILWFFYKNDKIDKFYLIQTHVDEFCLGALRICTGLSSLKNAHHLHGSVIPAE